MAELKDTLAPELDLIEGRVMTPAKEFKELLQRCRKTIVKRNHKVGYYSKCVGHFNAPNSYLISIASTTRFLNSVKRKIRV